MIFETKINHKWFTLIELMVVIALIAMIILGATRIDFNRSSNQQKLAIFTGDIVSKIETVRNNALIGKWIWTDVETPESWDLIISDTSSWSLETRYSLWGRTIDSEEYSVTPDNFYSIWNLRCIQLDGTTSEIISPDATITIDGSNMILSWCSNDNFKILEFTTSYRQWNQSVSINTLSWLVEVD